MPQNSTFGASNFGSSIFPKKRKLRLWHQIYGGDPLGSIMGPVGSNWVQKNVSNRKKITMPQNSNFRLPHGHRFFAKKNGIDGYGAKSPWGPPRVHLWVQWGPIGLKKWVKTVKNYHVPKFEFSITPRSSIFPKKMEVTVMAPSHGGDTIESILGPMGSHWVQKMGQNRKKLPCPKIRIFHYPAVIVFLQKLEVTVMAPNHGGDTIESILGPMGSHWVQKMGQNRKKLPCPKIRIFH